MGSTILTPSPQGHGDIGAWGHGDMGARAQEHISSTILTPFGLTLSGQGGGDMGTLGMGTWGPEYTIIIMIFMILICS